MSEHDTLFRKYPRAVAACNYRNTLKGGRWVVVEIPGGYMLHNTTFNGEPQYKVVHPNNYEVKPHVCRCVTCGAKWSDRSD
jgi:hypothetical protein